MRFSTYISIVWKISLAMVVFSKVCKQFQKFKELHLHFINIPKWFKMSVLIEHKTKFRDEHVSYFSVIGYLQYMLPRVRFSIWCIHEWGSHFCYISIKVMLIVIKLCATTEILQPFYQSAAWNKYVSIE